MESTCFTAPKTKTTGSISVKSGRDDIILSVIIPAYNLEKDICRCLESVLSQGIEGMEVIAVDNGSADHTGDIIRKYAEKYPQMRPIYLKENRWPAGARNAALNIARGKYVHFCDADDSVPKGAYHELLELAEEDQADIVTGNYSRMYPNENNAIRQFSHYQASTGFERCFESGNTTLWNKLYRRDLIERDKQRFSMKLRHSEDFLFYLQLLCKEPVVSYTDKSVYIYTDTFCHEESDTANSEIRYASLHCVRDGAYVYEQIFAKPITGHHNLWFSCYAGNLNWHVKCSWNLIQRPEERREAFEVLQKALVDTQRTTTACSWFEGNRMQSFIDIFGVDYPTFASLTYEEYMFTLARQTGIVPRGVHPSVTAKLRALSDDQRETLLERDARHMLEDLRTTYSKSYESGTHVWRQHYWNLLDSVINDNWRLLRNRTAKEDIFRQVQQLMSEMSGNSKAIGGFNSEADIHRFREMFCVDYAMFQSMSCSQYLAVHSTNICNRGGGGGGYAPTADPLMAYIAACRNGHIGLRGILQGIKAWLKSKLHSRR